MTDPISSPRFQLDLRRVSATNRSVGDFQSCDAQLEVCSEFVARHLAEGWLWQSLSSILLTQGKNMERPECGR